MRKEYSKPTLMHVDLVPEEAVLGACKTYGYMFAAFGGNDCTSANNGHCYAVGS